MLPFRTLYITIVLQTFDEQGIIRCPIDDQGYFGLTIQLDPTIPVSKNVQKYLSERLKLPALGNEVEVISLIEPQFSIPGKDPTMVLVAKIARDSFQAPSEWPTFMSFMRGLSQGPMRLAYNKAFQYLAGAHLNDVDVLEVDSIVKKRLEELSRNS